MKSNKYGTYTVTKAADLAELLQKINADQAIAAKAEARVELLNQYSERFSKKFTYNKTIQYGLFTPARPYSTLKALSNVCLCLQSMSEYRLFFSLIGRQELNHLLNHIGRAVFKKQRISDAGGVLSSLFHTQRNSAGESKAYEIGLALSQVLSTQ